MNRNKVQVGKQNSAKQVLQSKGFVRLCETVATKGQLVALDSDAIKNITKKGSDKDWYTSLYYYGQDAMQHYKANNNSMKGYKGSAYSNKLLFDFDSENDPFKAKSDAVTLLERLQEEGVKIAESCRVYFSGNKGFHVEVVVNKAFTPEELKPICKNLAADLKTFDTSVYNTTRLVRLVNTKHAKSGLYKIELHPDDLLELSIDQIKERAQKPVVYPDFELKPVENLDFIKKYQGTMSLYAKPVIVDCEDTDGIRGLDIIDFTKIPRGMPRCIYALSQGIMMPGERNHLFFRLAAYYRNQGMTKDVCYNTLKGIARENKRIYTDSEQVSKDELWNTVINSVYGEGWKQVPGAIGTDEQNELLEKYCKAVGEHTDKRCILHSSAAKPKVVKIDDVFEDFMKYTDKFDQNTVKTGIGFIDNNMSISTGTTTLLVGASGSGKSSLALNIMENANALGQYTIFFSLDMHKNLVYLKLAQKVTNYKQKDLLEIFKTKDPRVTEIKKTVADKYGKTFFDFSPVLSLEQMRDRILDIQDKNGVDIRLVVVDYASRIDAPNSDIYSKARHNALMSTGTAIDTDAAWLIISQVSRQTGDGCTPIRTKRAAKDSGDWEETATNVITCWRPYMGDPNRDDVMRLFLAKNRMGRELEQVLEWNGAKGLICDMSQEDLAMYEDERGDEAEREYRKSRYDSKFKKD